MDIRKSNWPVNEVWTIIERAKINIDPASMAECLDPNQRTGFERVIHREFKSKNGKIVPTDFEFFETVIEVGEALKKNIGLDDKALGRSLSHTLVLGYTSGDPQNQVRIYSASAVNPKKLDSYFEAILTLTKHWHPHARITRVGKRKALTLGFFS